MNWRAGPAGEVVAASLHAQFEEARRSSVLTFYPNCRVTALKPSTISTARVIAPATTVVGRIYDVVILAIGFGLEAYLEGETPSYWIPSQMAAPLLVPLLEPNGDGGLVDFLMAAFNAMEHRAICELIIGLLPRRFDTMPSAPTWRTASNSCRPMPATWST
jgi:hypothetical protein